MEDIATSGSKAGGAIGHDPSTLSLPNLPTEVGLAGSTELALSTFRRARFGGRGENRGRCGPCGSTGGGMDESFDLGSKGDDLLECHYMIARLDRGDALTDGLDDAGSFMSEDDGKGSFGIFAGESVGVYGGMAGVSLTSSPLLIHSSFWEGVEWTTNRCGTRQYSRPRCGPHGPWEGRRRRPRR